MDVCAGTTLDRIKVGKDEITVMGKPVVVDAIWIENKEIIVTGKRIKMARIKDEWFGEEVEDPVSLLKKLNDCKYQADLFTFVQRLPENKPKYNYSMDWVSFAALPIISFDHWWEKQIPKDVRKKVKKAEKMGVIVKVVDFDDKFVEGITKIYNESPIRQGKPFWHYGKDFDTVKKEASTYLDKSDFMGAYYNDELIGFIKLVYLGKCASTMHVISEIKHRDKAPTNALLAKTVEICDRKKVHYLTYGEWNKGTLVDFKRYNGFVKTDLPRYYIPLTTKGKMVLKLNLHRGASGLIPEGLIAYAVSLREKWYSKRMIEIKDSAKN